MTRSEAIEILTSTTLGDEIGLGGYRDSAAYKLTNGDIDATTEGLTDEVREAIRAISLIGATVTGGEGDDADRGVVDAVSGGMATVRWESLVVTDAPLSMLTIVAPAPSLEFEEIGR